MFAEISAKSRSLESHANENHRFSADSVYTVLYCGVVSDVGVKDVRMLHLYFAEGDDLMDSKSA